MGCARYLEITLSVPAEAAEAVGAALCDLGSPGLAVEDRAAACDVVGYLPEDGGLEDRLGALEAELARLTGHFPALAQLRRHERFVDPSDFADAWKPHFHPVRIGRRLLIVPTWEEAAARPGERLLRLDPGMAFGTGTHPSTALCLEALEGVAAPGSRGLDVGTGSGILAIAAALQGASVLALDRDPVAVKVAKENVAVNRVADRVEVRYAELPDVLAASPPPFDWAVCNLTADLVAGLAPDLARSLRIGGCLVASGIVLARQAEVARALGDAGLRPSRQTAADGWAAVWAVRR